MDIAKEVIAAEKRYWMEYSPYYSRLTEANVHFKVENLQHTGSFKLRGAMNKTLSLSPAQRQFLQIQHMLIEGAAAVAVSAMLKRQDRLAGKIVIVIICGANIILETLKTIL